MHKYFSTFIPGLGEVVQQQLEQDLKDFRTTSPLDGLIVYESSSSPNEVKNLRYLNNSFLKLESFSMHVPLNFQPAKTFRVIISRENEFVHIPNSKLEKFEATVKSAYHLQVDRTSPDIEFWKPTRKEGQELFGIRITKHPDRKKVLAKGQLRPELANLLCIISEPQASDTVLDPFAGSGAISAERALLPHKKILTGDISGNGREISKMDATSLTGIEPEGIDKIITDPPWGISVGQDLDLENFYQKMLSEFYRVLKPRGIAVILIGKKELFENLLKKYESKFKSETKYDILVSGKKAGVFKIRVLAQTKTN